MMLRHLMFKTFFSFITGHDGCARFRMMFEFLLIILSAFGFSRLFSNSFVFKKVVT